MSLRPMAVDPMLGFNLIFKIYFQSSTHIEQPYGQVSQLFPKVLVIVVTVCLERLRDFAMKQTKQFRDGPFAVPPFFVYCITMNFLCPFVYGHDLSFLFLMYSSWFPMGLSFFKFSATSFLHTGGGVTLWPELCHSTK